MDEIVKGFNPEAYLTIGDKVETRCSRLARKGWHVS